MITRSQKNKFRYDYLSENYFNTKKVKTSSLITESDFISETETIISEESDFISETEDLEDNKSDNLDDTIDEDELECLEEINDDPNLNEFKFLKHNLYSILDGSFFEENSQNYSIPKLKSKLSLIDAQFLNNELLRLKNQYFNKNLNILNILNMNLSDDLKKKVFEKIYIIANSEVLTDEYISNIKELNELINSNTEENIKLNDLEKEINNNLDKEKNGILINSYKNQILTSEMGFSNKLIAYKYMKIMEGYGQNSSSEENIKYKTWLNTLLNVPFNKYYEIDINYNCLNSIKNYITEIRSKLDNDLSFLEIPKDQIINIISQLIRNPKSNINAIGLFGNKGLGKTQFVECVAKALNRPLVRISLGGNSDATVIKGHNFTYIGSRQGKIVDALIDSKIMNPIIFFDEIDKISNTEHGKDITGTLIHLIDLTTNNKYNGDEYFSGVEFDLSRALFMFTYNDPNQIDSILADRIYKIQIHNYTISEKIEITKTHIINSVLSGFNFTHNDIQFESDAITYLVETSKFSEGMRPIKSKIQIIISRINTLLLTDETKNIINLQYKILYNLYKSLPIIIKKEHIDILLENSIFKDNIEDLNYLNMYM